MYEAIASRFFGNSNQAQKSIITIAISIQLFGVILVVFAGYVVGKTPIILSSAALLALVLAVGWFLIRAAKAYEADASTGDLEYVTNLLMSGRLINFGRLIANVLPNIFDRLFGSNLISPLFIWKSFIATSLFWIILVLFRHPSPLDLGAYSSHHVYNWVFVILMYPTTWVALVKTRFLLGVMLRTHKLTAILGVVVIDAVTTLALVVIDAIISYVLPFLIVMGLSFTPLSPMYGVSGHIQFYVDVLRSLTTIKDYLTHHSQNIHLITAIQLSPLLTSVWMTIMIVSIIIAMLLYSTKYLERFIAVSWFLEVEKSPVKAIAKVAGSLMFVVAAIGILFWT